MPKRKSLLDGSVLPLLFVFLFGEDDHELAEDVDKVEEQVDRVPDVVVVSAASLLHDELGVVQHKGAEDEETKVQVDVKEHGGSQEDVGEGQDHEPGEGGHQGAAHEEESAVVVVERSNCEADEDHRGSQQGSGNDAWLNGDGHIKQGTQGHS